MTKLITPEFRGSFVHLLEPHAMKAAPGEKQPDPRYSITMAIPKGDAFWAKFDKMVEEAAVGKWGKIPPKLKVPKKDGDDVDMDGNPRPEFQGKFTVAATSKNKPGIVDANLQPVISADEIYSGAWYRASIRAYAWEHATGGRGVSIALDNVMKARDDEAFSGRSKAENDFAGFAKANDDLLG
jgi:hypothetical protein